MKTLESEMKITYKIMNSGKLNDIQIFDHLIINIDGGYYNSEDEWVVQF